MIHQFLGNKFSELKKVAGCFKKSLTIINCNKTLGNPHFMKDHCKRLRTTSITEMKLWGWSWREVCNVNIRSIKFLKGSKILLSALFIGNERTMVFVETKKKADFFATLLCQENISTTSIHGWVNCWVGNIFVTFKIKFWKEIGGHGWLPNWLPRPVMIILLSEVKLVIVFPVTFH